MVMDATSNSAGRRLRTRKRSRSPSPLLPQPPPSLRPASSRPERYRDHHYRGERGGSSPSSLPYHGGCRESLPRRSPSPCFAPPPPSPLLPVSSRPEHYLVHDGCGRGSPTYSPYCGGRGQSLPRNSPSMPLKRSRLGDEYGCRGNSSGERFVDPKQDYGFLNPPGPGGSHDYMGRGPRSGRCLNCGIEGHWARDCNAGDWKNKGYFSGERDHVDRKCQNSPKNLKRGRSNSRLPSPCCERSQSRSYSRCRRRYSDPNATGEKPLTQQSSEDTRRMNSGNVDEVRPVRRYKRSYRRYTWQNRTAHRIPVLSGRRQEPRGDCSYFSTVAAMESQLRLLCAFPDELSISYIKKKDEKMKQLNGYKRMGRNQRLLKILKESGIPKRLDYRAYCQGKIVECRTYKI